MITLKGEKAVNMDLRDDYTKNETEGVKIRKDNRWSKRLVLQVAPYINLMH